MPWIESHTCLMRHRKLIFLARDLCLRRSHACGHLHALWHAALETQEDGDLSQWTDEMIAEFADFSGDASQFVRLLQSHGFLDGKIIHDWLDYAGHYLISKYSSSKREKLVAIWAKHGREYNTRGKAAKGFTSKRIKSEFKANSKRTKSEHTNQPTNQPTNQDFDPQEDVLDSEDCLAKPNRAPNEPDVAWLARQWIFFLRRKPLRDELDDAKTQFGEWVRLGAKANAIEAEIKSDKRDRTETLWEMKRRLVAVSGPSPPDRQPQKSLDEQLQEAREHNRKQLESIR